LKGRSLLGGVLAGLCACLGLALGSAPRDSGHPAPVRPGPLALPAAPGGPILVVTPGGSGFGRYLPEMLRAEGLDEFAVAGASALQTATLRRHAVVVLAPGTLARAQIRTLTRWVRGGGRLVAMRPDRRLAPLLGLRARGGALADGYLAVDTHGREGRGIAATTMQFHGAADRYALRGARAIATLYSDATTSTGEPAITTRDVGRHGGRVVAFAYDLPRSIVETRQGNPAWAGTERDGDQDRVIRPDDLFFGAKAGDRRRDWVDLAKVSIPQADEQQRLLANLLTGLSRIPLPRFWYLPHGYDAAVVLTGDDHGSGGSGSLARFAQNVRQSPKGCSVEDWTCVRSTSYAFATTELSDEFVRRFQDSGFELALHTRVSGRAAGEVNPGGEQAGQCRNFSAEGGLVSDIGEQLAQLRRALPDLQAPITNRTHCVVWSTWVGTARAEAAMHIGLDTTYYYWPGQWVANRPGVFTGSAMPMRFADADGSLVGVYQAATQITDESGQAIGPTIDALLDAATGPQGAYGVYTANIHTDASNTHARGDAAAIVASAQAHGVPVISARQLLTWLVGRDRSSFGDPRFRDGRLSFTVHQAPGAHGLQAMLPVRSSAGILATLSCAGRRVATHRRTVKGTNYAVFDAPAGRCAARYSTAASR
jgi:hypothetical protein